MSTRKPTALWIKMTCDGVTNWVNTGPGAVRRIRDSHCGCEIVFTTRDVLRVDQPIEAVMEALGYKSPPPPKLETHEAPALEDHSGGNEFVAESGLSPKQP